MQLFYKVLNNPKYLNIAHEIGRMQFITNGKWDWEHGLGHYQRVAEYVKQILSQLAVYDREIDDRTISLGMIAALLHDIGLIKGEKKGHALESSKMFAKFLENTDVTDSEKQILEQAIRDHSNGNEICSNIGLALVLADKLDVTYHRTIHSSIQDYLNQHIQKIQKVTIEITDLQLIVTYWTNSDFDSQVLEEWEKAITIPEKVANILKRKFVFNIKHCELNYNCGDHSNEKVLQYYL